MLLVEDRSEGYERITALLHGVLGDGGEIRQIRDTRELESSLRQGEWQLVVCADGRPGLDCRAVMAEVNRIPRVIPVVLIAAPGSDEAAAELLAEGLTDYVFEDRLARLPRVIRRLCDSALLGTGPATETPLRFSQAINRLGETIVVHSEPEIILDTLARIVGEVLGLDRSLIYDVRLEDHVAEALCEWLNPAADGLSATKGTYPLDLFADAVSLMDRTHSWIDSHAERIHPALRSGVAGGLLHGQMQIRALLWWPFAFRDNGFYLLALNQVHQDREWTFEERHFLETASRFVNMAFVKIALLREQGHVAEALERSERRYREVFDNASDAILLAETSPDGQLALVDINPAGRAALGIPNEPGLLLANVLPEHGRADALMHFSECLRTGLAHSYLEDVPGDRSLQMTLIPLSDAGAVTSRVLGLGRDITQQLRHEQYARSISENFEDAIQAIATTLEHRDPYTAGHQRRVAALAAAIGAEMGLSEDQIHGLRLVGIVHDLGKIRIPSEILSKPGTLNPLEYEMVKMHSAAAYDILKGIKFPWPIAQAVYQHHERMDGSGYPQGLRGSEILIEARILAVADIVEAMSSHRPYRAGLGLESAFEEILAQRGQQYDADVVDACIRVFRSGHFEFPPP